MSGRSIIIVLCAVLVLSTATGSAIAGEESGTKTIQGMEPFAIEIENTGSDQMKVSWDLNLTDGVPFNAALVDEDNYEKFSSGLRYEAYNGQQKNYTLDWKRTVKVDEGKYYLVIESAHSSMDSSTVKYVVKWDEDVSSIGWAPWCWPVLIILVLVFGVGILFWLWRVYGSGSAAVGPRTDVAPGPGTGDVAHLSPQPEPPDIPPEPGAVGMDEGPAPGTGVVHPPGEGAAELSPQPEPPDMPEETPYRGGSEPPAPGTGVYHPPAEGAAELGPQPEPPDMPSSTDTLRPTGADATSLSPQPEPPDLPSTLEGGERPVIPEASEIAGPDAPVEEPVVLPQTIPTYPEVTPPEMPPTPSPELPPSEVTPHPGPQDPATALETGEPSSDPYDHSLEERPPEPEPRTDKVRAPDPDGD